MYLAFAVNELASKKAVHFWPTFEISDFNDNVADDHDFQDDVDSQDDEATRLRIDGVARAGVR